MEGEWERWRKRWVMDVISCCQRGGSMNKSANGNVSTNSKTRHMIMGSTYITGEAGELYCMIVRYFLGKILLSQEQLRNCKNSRDSIATESNIRFWPWWAVPKYLYGGGSCLLLTCKWKRRLKSTRVICWIDEIYECGLMIAVNRFSFFFLIKLNWMDLLWFFLLFFFPIHGCSWVFAAISI